jgi:hypothetical protein
MLTLRVDTPHLEANPKFKGPAAGKGVKLNPQQQAQQRHMQEYQRIMRDYQQALNAKNPIQRAQALQRYQMDLARFQMSMQREYAQMMQRAYKDPNYKKNVANNTTDPFIVVTTSKEFEFEIQEKAVVRKMYLPTEFDDTGKLRVYSDKEKAELRGDDKTKPGYMAKLDEVMPGAEAKILLTPPKKKAKDDTEDMVGIVDRGTIHTIILTKESPEPTIVGSDNKGKKKDKKK